jgi:hypothetical protein
MGWADDMYDAGYTSNHGGLMDEHGAKLKELGCFLIKKPRKATKRLTFCTAAELNKFVDALIVEWEANELTLEEVDKLANSLMADAAEGKLLANGKVVYAKTLGAKLKELGCFLIKKPRKATKHLPLCSKQDLNEFLDALIVGWETNERTQKEVHERCLILMDDAASGKLLVNGKVVYAKTLVAKLQGRGYFLEETPKGKMEIDPSYL